MAVTRKDLKAAGNKKAPAKKQGSASGSTMQTRNASKSSGNSDKSSKENISEASKEKAVHHETEKDEERVCNSGDIGEGHESKSDVKIGDTDNVQMITEGVMEAVQEVVKSVDTMNPDKESCTNSTVANEDDDKHSEMVDTASIVELCNNEALESEGLKDDVLDKNSNNENTCMPTTINESETKVIENQNISTEDMDVSKTDIGTQNEAQSDDVSKDASQDNVQNDAEDSSEIKSLEEKPQAESLEENAQKESLEEKPQAESLEETAQEESLEENSNTKSSEENSEEKSTEDNGEAELLKEKSEAKLTEEDGQAKSVEENPENKDENAEPMESSGEDMAVDIEVQKSDDIKEADANQSLDLPKTGDSTETPDKLKTDDDKEADTIVDDESKVRDSDNAEKKCVGGVSMAEIEEDMNEMDDISEAELENSDGMEDISDTKLTDADTNEKSHDNAKGSDNKESRKSSGSSTRDSRSRRSSGDTRSDKRLSHGSRTRERQKERISTKSKSKERNNKDKSKSTSSTTKKETTKKETKKETTKKEIMKKDEPYGDTRQINTLLNRRCFNWKKNKSQNQYKEDRPSSTLTALGNQNSGSSKNNSVPNSLASQQHLQGVMNFLKSQQERLQIITRTEALERTTLGQTGSVGYPSTSTQQPVAPLPVQPGVDPNWQQPPWQQMGTVPQAGWPQMGVWPQVGSVPEGGWPQVGTVPDGSWPQQGVVPQATGVDGTWQQMGTMPFPGWQQMGQVSQMPEGGWPPMFPVPPGGWQQLSTLPLTSWTPEMLTRYAQSCGYTGPVPEEYDDYSWDGYSSSRRYRRSPSYDSSDESPVRRRRNVETIDYKHRPAALVFEGRGERRGRSRERSRDRSRDRRSRDRSRTRRRDWSRDRGRYRDRSRERFRERRDWDRDRRDWDSRDRSRERYRDRERDRSRERFRERNWSRGSRERSRERDRDSYSNRGEDRYRDAPRLSTQSSGGATTSSGIGLQSTPINELVNPLGNEKQPEELVVIVQGPPGSGKTFVAKLVKDKQAK